jgi:hypothetical protein
LIPPVDEDKPAEPKTAVPVECQGADIAGRDR